MKNFKRLAFLALTLSHYSHSAVVTKCGQYSVSYEGVRTGHFLGVKVALNEFKITEPDGTKLSTFMTLNSEGGTLKAERVEKITTASGVVKEATIYELNSGWGEKSLTVSSKGQATQKIYCE
jgi:hypothetical protein